MKGFSCSVGPVLLFISFMVYKQVKLELQSSLQNLLEVFIGLISEVEKPGKE